MSIHFHLKEEVGYAESGFSICLVSDFDMEIRVLT